jgi:hypothetical protein
MDQHLYWAGGIQPRCYEEAGWRVARADSTALADYLGGKPFFHGDRPNSLDAVAHAFIVNTVVPPIDSPAKRHALTFPNLAAYCRRMREALYGNGPG